MGAKSAPASRQSFPFLTQTTSRFNNSLFRASLLECVISSNHGRGSFQSSRYFRALNKCRVQPPNLKPTADFSHACKINRVLQVIDNPSFQGGSLHALSVLCLARQIGGPLQVSICQYLTDGTEPCTAWLSAMPVTGCLGATPASDAAYSSCYRTAHVVAVPCRKSNC